MRDNATSALDGPVVDSTGANYDIIRKADFTADVWDLSDSVSAIDAMIAHGALGAGNGFNTKLAAAVDAGHLGAHHAVLFTPDSGNLSGKMFLIVDLNGAAGYQADADLVVQLSGAQNLASLDTGDFI